MKRLPITHKAKQSSSPLRFDYKFAKGVADQVSASKKFIAAGDAIGLGIDSAERRIARQQEQADAVRQEKAGGEKPVNMKDYDDAADNVNTTTTQTKQKLIK